MKRVITILLIAILTLGFAGCGEKENTDKAEESKPVSLDIFKSKKTTTFDTGISAPTYAISDEDYQKYNDIMDYLYAYHDKEESTLFNELSSQYGQTPEELKQWMNDNMQNAIDRDAGKTTQGSKITQSDVDNIISLFFNENIKDTDKLSLPAWLNARAIEHDVNFSQTLQEAL